jgi:hypothetical protein
MFILSYLLVISGCFIVFPSKFVYNLFSFDVTSLIYLTLRLILAYQDYITSTTYPDVASNAMVMSEDIVNKRQSFEISVQCL